MTKAFVKNFENFRGLSYRSSDLSRPPNYAKEAVNIRISKPYNIKGEPGFKIKAQPKPIYGLCNYVYQDVTGQVQEELLGINEILWKLAETYLEITHVGAATAGSYEIAVNTSSNVFEFILKEGSTTVLTADLGYGYGSGNMTLQGLANAINAASTEYTAKVLYTCVVNGNQNNVGWTSSPITIDAGSDMSNRSGEWVELITDADGCGTYRYLTDVTGTSISWNHGDELNVTDNQVFGHGLFPAAILPITDGAVAFDITGGVASNAARIYYNYWKPVSFQSSAAGTPTAITPIFDNYYLLKTGQAIGEPFASSVDENNPVSPIPNASFVNAENCCFIAAGGTQQIVKYDGNSTYKSGMLKPGQPTSAVGSATGITGTYFYKITYVMKDSRNRITEGEISEASAPITLANEKGSVTIDPIYVGAYDEQGYHTGCAKINGAQVTVTTITVDTNHSLRVGDTAYFYDSVSVNYVERLITAVANNSITIAGAAVTVADNDIISANLRVAIYRTLDTGTDEFYLVAEIPHNAIDGAGGMVYLDTKTDGDLGAQYIDPVPSTKIRYIPPYAKYLTLHQGLLVAAEGFTRGQLHGGTPDYFPDFQAATNTILWSDAVAGLEAWPLVNEERISSETKGQITGIASDAEDSLIVFKEDEIHSIAGDLDSNTYRQVEVARGYGVSSHNSIQKFSIERISANTPAGETSKFIAGLGKHGIVFIYGGKVVRELTMEMRGKFYQQNQSEDKGWYAYEMSEACFNPIDYEYKVSMPVINADADVHSSSTLYRFDTEEGAWLRSNYDYTFSGGVLNQTGGMAVYQDQTYFVSHYDGIVDGACKSALFAYHSPSIGAKAYAANTFPITQDFIPQWDFVGETAIKKFWHQIVYYTSQSSEEFIPFSVRIRTYRNWEDPFTATASTDKTLTFTSETEVEKFFDLKLGTNAKAMLFRFTVSAIHTCLNLTGYEYSVSMNVVDQVKK